MTVTTGNTPFAPLLEIALGTDTFAANWDHCDRIATYVARMVSHNRTDSLLYANLFSSALNELLETAFRAHNGGGEISCTVSRSGPVDRIELTIPCNDKITSFYANAINDLSAADVADRYVAALLAEGELDPRIGLLELAVDYKAKLALTPMGQDKLRLVADLTLEDTY
ncbi:MAG: ubiquinone biosynthesis methyltransferase UbiE [Parvibaculum sp.]|nr:ubiquinone biosynthesis methyltransferase UbiE [Parvibaculum sp.]